MSIATVGPAKSNDVGPIIGCVVKQTGRSLRSVLRLQYLMAHLIGLMDPFWKTKAALLPHGDMEEQAAKSLFTGWATGKGQRIQGVSLRTECGGSQLEQHRKRPAKTKTRAGRGSRATCPPCPASHPCGGIMSTAPRLPLGCRELGGTMGNAQECHRSQVGQGPSSDCECPHISQQCVKSGFRQLPLASIPNSFDSAPRGAG